MSVPVAYVAVVIIWSTTPLGIVWSSESVSPTMAVLMRMLIAGLLGCLIIKFSRVKLPWHRQARMVYIYSALGIFGGMSLCYMAATYLSSGMISLIFGLSPIISGLLSQRILAEPKFSRVRQIAMLISLLGLAIVCSNSLSLNHESELGLLFILLAVFFFSLSGVLVKSVEADIHPMATTVGALWVSIPLFALTWALFDGTLPVTQWQAGSLWAILYLGIFGSLIGFVAYFYVLQKLAPSTVALITLMTPVLALGLGAYLNDETVTLSLILGTIFVMLGLVLYQWGEKIPQRKKQIEGI